MGNSDRAQEELNNPRASPFAFLSFFQSSGFVSLQGRLAIELVSEAKLSREIELDDVGSDSDCACG